MSGSEFNMRSIDELCMKGKGWGRGQGWRGGVGTTREQMWREKGACLWWRFGRRFWNWWRVKGKRTGGYGGRNNKTKYHAYWQFWKCPRPWRKILLTNIEQWGRGCLGRGWIILNNEWGCINKFHVVLGSRRQCQLISVHGFPLCMFKIWHKLKFLWPFRRTTSTNC